MKRIIFIVTFALFWIAGASQQDDTTKYLKYPGTYGIQQPRVWATKVLRAPLDTIYTKSGLAIIGSTAYVGNGVKWTAAGGGSTIDTTNKWVQDSYVRSDSLFKYKNGTETFLQRFYPYNTNPLGYLTGNQSITLSGDVSGSGTTAITTTIGNNKVTGAMIAMGSDAAGDILYYNGTDYVRLPAGTVNQILHGGTTPAWRDTTAVGGGSGDMILASTQTNSGAKTFLDGTMLLRNVANTFSSQFTNTNTAARIYTLPDRALTIDNITTATTSNGTGFIKANGSVISFDNSTYLTTEVDGSTSNELQTFANTSAATTHTVTLSNSGGSIQLVEGSGITLTTTGTSLDGIVTIASTGGVSAANPTASIGLTVVNGSASTFMRSDAAPPLDVTISPTWTGTHIHRKAVIAATSTDAVILDNNTAATVGAQQWSPRLRLTGQGWKTAATAASQTVDWTIETVPVQDVTNPSSYLVFSDQTNALGYTGNVYMFSSGAFGVGSSTDPGASGIINVSTGFRIANAAASTNYLRGNGTNFVSSAIQAGDVPTLNQNTSGSAASVSGTNVITNANLRQGIARSVIGVTGNATANVADIQGTTDQVLRVATDGLSLGFGTVATAGITANAITLAKMAQVATATVFYRKTAGTGDPEVNTLATLKTDLGLTGTNSGDQTITLTSDVTGTGTGSFATTIAANAVTYAKMQIMTANKLLGSGLSGTAVAEITLGTNLSFTGTTLNATGGSGTPGGSNKQVQYNNSSAFGGAAGFEIGNTNNRVLIQAQAASEVPLIVKATSGQSADLQAWKNNGDTNLVRLDQNGIIYSRGVSNPLIITDAGGSNLAYFSGGNLTLNNNLNFLSSTPTLAFGVGALVQARYYADGANTNAYFDMLETGKGATLNNRTGANIAFEINSLVAQTANIQNWKNNSVLKAAMTSNGNLLANSIYVGSATAAPTSLLHLAAGTATANTAPLKLTSGPLMTTAEVGAIEFLTDRFYGTITTAAERKTFAFTSDITGTNSGTNTGDQSLANTSDATSHTVTLTGGTSVQLIEGTNITLTTGGTGGVGTVTIASTAGGGNVTKVGTPVNNQLGVWTGDGTIEGDANLTWDGTKLVIPVNSTTSYQNRIGTFLTQSYATNNGFITDNGYYDGATWQRLATGYATGFQFQGGQLIIHGVNTGTGSFTQVAQAKFDYTGAFAVGANISGTLGNFTGATFYHKATGQLQLSNYLLTSSFPGTAVGALGFDASGNIITMTASGSGDMVLASVQTVTGLKTFDKDKLAMKGTSTGVTTISTANASVTSYTATLQAATGTLAYLSDIPSTPGIDAVLAVGQALTANRQIDATSGTGWQITYLLDDNVPLIFRTTTGLTTSLGITTYDEHITSGVAGNGFGLYKSTNLEASDGTSYVANKFNTSWSNATAANRTSEYSIEGLNNAVQATLLTLSGSGSFRLNKYGVNSFTGTAAYWLAVTNTGQLIEMAAPSGGGDMILASAQTNSGAKTFLDGTMLLRNVANTFNGVFTNTNTAARTYTLKDANGTIAFVSDITGTNSGTNTGDQTTIVGITGTTAQFNTALTDNDFATLAGTETLTNKTISIASNTLTGTTAQWNTANTDDDFLTTNNTVSAVTNKFLVPRVVTVASSATPTPDVAITDFYTVTALAVAATFGSPGAGVDGQTLTIRIKDNATARALAWNVIYRAGTNLALPTTTTISKTMYVKFIYNVADAKWDLVSVLDGL